MDSGAVRRRLHWHCGILPRRDSRDVLPYRASVRGGLGDPDFGLIFILILPVFGLKNPWYALLVAPVIGFIVIMVVFKPGGFAVHKKLDGYYKYKAMILSGCSSNGSTRAPASSWEWPTASSMFWPSAR